MKTSCFTSSFGTIKMEYEEDCLYLLQIFSPRERKTGQRTPPEALCGISEERRLCSISEEKELCGFAGKVSVQIEEYYWGVRKSFDIPCRPRGTEFQQRVWRELMKIPYGETRSYEEIANAAGSPGASRAVGGACKKNPIWLIIPCHRVIGKNGQLTGYAGGTEMKERLLALEQRRENISSEHKLPAAGTGLTLAASAPESSESGSGLAAEKPQKPVA